MIGQLLCRFLPWHTQAWTGRKSATGQVLEAKCNCGRRYAVKLTEPHAWAALPAEEFEAAIGWASRPKGE